MLLPSFLPSFVSCQLAIDFSSQRKELILLLISLKNSKFGKSKQRHILFTFTLPSSSSHPCTFLPFLATLPTQKGKKENQKEKSFTSAADAPLQLLYTDFVQSTFRKERCVDG